ncbi:MAG: hypothetical protein IE934_16460 [Sphingopyxis sp.]|nr:hypothetical protein [Sphingopyxis sp.]
MRIVNRAAPLLLLLPAACAQTGTVQTAATVPAPFCGKGADSLDSPPGKVWWDANRWRYADDEAATKAYALLVGGASPWPDWYSAYDSTLPVGTRFQMAIGGTQTPEMPGNFGTFDRITSVEDVRERLAVRDDWKPQVDRVVTYEVVTPVPVKIGPIGPQVDPKSCRYLAGRWSQFQAMVPRGTLFSHLKVVEVRPIR